MWNFVFVMIVLVKRIQIFRKNVLGLGVLQRPNGRRGFFYAHRARTSTTLNLSFESLGYDHQRL